MSLQVITFHLSIPRFKLHLRSKIGAGQSIDSGLPPLPLNKTVVEVFGDFLVAEGRAFAGSTVFGPTGLIWGELSESRNPGLSTTRRATGGRAAHARRGA